MDPLGIIMLFSSFGLAMLFILLSSYAELHNNDNYNLTEEKKQRFVIFRNVNFDVSSFFPT
jgi:hypothetical protein